MKLTFALIGNVTIVGLMTPSLDAFTDVGVVVPSALPCTEKMTQNCHLKNLLELSDKSGNAVYLGLWRMLLLSCIFSYPRHVRGMLPLFSLYPQL